MTLEQLNSDKKDCMIKMQQAYDNWKRYEGILLYLEQKIKELADKIKEEAAKDQTERGKS